MQLSRRHLLLAASAAALAVPGAPARAQVTPDAVQAAARFIDALGRKAIAVLQQNQGSLEQREAALRAILSRNFDLPFIGRFVLGRHWRRASAEQRAEYQAVFAEWLLQTYARRLGGYSNQTFKVGGARAAGKKDVMVKTRIGRPSGPPIVADWRVRASGGQFRIIDIMVEGISMAVTQRSDFSAVVKQRGIAGLLQILRARTEKYAVAS
jgi:phospholipid transport system substrate-binding protein